MIDYQETNLPDDNMQYKKAFRLGTCLHKRYGFAEDEAEQFYRNTAIASLKLVSRYNIGASEALTTAILLGPIGAEHVCKDSGGYALEYGDDVIGIVASLSSDAFAKDQFTMKADTRDCHLYMMLSSVATMEHVILKQAEDGTLDTSIAKQMHTRLEQILEACHGIQPALDDMLDCYTRQLDDYMKLDQMIETSPRHKFVNPIKRDF